MFVLPGVIGNILLLQKQDLFVNSTGILSQNSSISISNSFSFQQNGCLRLIFFAKKTEITRVNYEEAPPMK